MASAAPILPQGPIAAINTTPLIDVMLVLLIMFVITIPAATNSVDIDLPAEGVTPPAVPDSIKNKVVLTSQGRILWNGIPVTRPQLAALLLQTTRMPVEPELQFEPSADATYDKTLHVLDTIKASGVTRFGFVGNERHRAFEK
ncbi:ExbD/TolR family protein [Novosphingobium album (ex Hu et al. 2023)]|uniref:Biopolymer transporter ExbD n=1 Tax=Novosphingobium album (ex Hu et al. 2023) TaxID=2930093 RepID=A0ABT0B6Z9_9SPHN|nr:biopolymer transporter ExbD [Novosphingobium album (ex Hu et al. 2023)]MCJ2180793.1 biopolymer transporter ExbD [Novosphingobium album (ex Hu et al. 2023)]